MRANIVWKTKSKKPEVEREIDRSLYHNVLFKAKQA